jgi:hypothetical protein
MQPTPIHPVLARAVQLERLSAEPRAARRAAASHASPRKPAAPSPAAPDALTIRPAGPADREPLARLAELDGRSRGWSSDRDVLMAVDAGGRALAAVDLAAPGEAVSDPFRRAQGALALLVARARQLRAEPRRRRAVARLRLLPRQIT